MLVLAVPVHPPHFILLKELLQNVEEQTVQPDLVVIAASSVKRQDHEDYLDQLAGAMQHASFAIRIMKTRARCNAPVPWTVPTRGSTVRDGALSRGECRG